jgi:hypothetical protein
VDELTKEILRLTADVMTSDRQREEAAIRAKVLEGQLAALRASPWWRRLGGRAMRRDQISGYLGVIGCCALVGYGSGSWCVGIGLYGALALVTEMRMDGTKEHIDRAAKTIREDIAKGQR